MARALRIEFPGAFYHVYSRGNRKEPIFQSDEDRFFFLKCLRDAFEKFSSVTLVYCLMENHYHLFLRTLAGHLSRVMHMINGTYASYFNRKWERCGHTFQGRYQSILVEADVYAQELSAYIHLNPVEASIVESPVDYQWSNYKEYLGLRNPEPWTDTTFLLGLFSPRLPDARRLYSEYVNARIGHPSDQLRRMEKTGVLATEVFLEKIKNLEDVKTLTRPNRDIPQLHKFKDRPPLKSFRDAAVTVMGSFNKLARNAAIFASHKNTDYTLRELSAYFDVGPSGITDICRRMRKMIPSSEPLCGAVREIERLVFTK